MNIDALLFKFETDVLPDLFEDSPNPSVDQVEEWWDHFLRRLYNEGALSEFEVTSVGGYHVERDESDAKARLTPSPMRVMGIDEQVQGLTLSLIRPTFAVFAKGDAGVFLAKGGEFNGFTVVDIPETLTHVIIRGNV